MKSRPSLSSAGGVELATSVGSVALANPIMTASGTAGHGAELARYIALHELGAVVVKSLSATPCAGNPAPRVHAVPGGMLNSVGLQGPGVAAWLAEELPALAATGAKVVVSIWGRTVEEYAAAAELLAPAPTAVVAVEVNLSCPNLDSGRHLFAQSPTATAAAMTATAACGRPRWAKLTPAVSDITEIAAAAMAAGAEALTLVNTALGMAIDPETRRYRLGAGAGGGGLSGAALHSMAVRAVHDVHVALPDAPIVGVGGVARATDAVELLLAGASAIQVGTATLADPRAPQRVLDDLTRWCDRHGVTRVRDLIGGVHE